MRPLSFWRALFRFGRKSPPQFTTLDVKVIAGEPVAVVVPEKAAIVPVEAAAQASEKAPEQSAAETLIEARAEPAAIEAFAEPAAIEARAEPAATEAFAEPAVIEALAEPAAIEALAEPAAIEAPPAESPSALPATLPRTPFRPVMANEQQRARVLYFTPAAYSRSTAAPRVLAPDLLFHLGTEVHRALGEASGTRPATTPAAPRVVPKREPRLLMEFATSQETDPRPDPSGRVLDVDPLLFSLFLANREAGPDVPAEATEQYLTFSPLLALGTELRDRVLQHWSAGGPPFRAGQLYSLARQVTAHAGTALLLCHNVTKAFARGGAAIEWQVTNRARGEYTNGSSTWVASMLHRAGVLKMGPFANPSIFYLLFSAAEFDGADPGDYYRCFAAATATWYAASGQARVPVEAPSPAAARQARLLSDIARKMSDETDPTPARRAWLWTNAMTFLEAAAWSRTQPAARTAAMVSARGASFGLTEADCKPERDWRWHVPTAGNAQAAAAELLAPDAVMPISR